MNATESRLTCEHCHGTDCKEMIAGEICLLNTAIEVFDLETNRVPTKWRKLRFAIVQGIEQQAGLKLVSNVWIRETVDETLDSHFFQRKSNRRHDWPPRRRQGSRSLAALSSDSSNLQYWNNKHCNDHRHVHGYFGRLTGLTVRLSELEPFINKGICDQLRYGQCQSQCFATVWISIPRRHNTVNGECPSPSITFLGRKYFDHVAFVFETLHGNSKLGWVRLLSVI